jgi:hypothetical protein
MARLGLPVSHDTMVTRILSYATTEGFFKSDAEWIAARDWYATAQNIALEFSREFGVPWKLPRR